MALVSSVGGKDVDIFKVGCSGSDGGGGGGGSMLGLFCHFYFGSE